MMELVDEVLWKSITAQTTVEIGLTSLGAIVSIEKE